MSDGRDHDFVGDFGQLSSDTACDASVEVLTVAMDDDEATRIARLRR